MITPNIYKIGEKVMCYGREAYVMGIQRGHRHQSNQEWGIYYDVAREPNAKRPDFHLHQSQLYPVKK